MGIDVVDRSIACDSSLVSHAATGVVASVVLHDVVLDERTSGPAIHSKVGVSRRVERSREVDVAKQSQMSVIYRQSDR